MTGQMCWLASFSTNGEKILHLRLQPHEPWKPYTAFTNHKVPDYVIPKGSKGWATFQHLFRAGWEVIPSDQARSIPTLATAAVK
ncbi:MAG: hypothetical protein HC827_11860 [Cyanobacteria bacterium RM1_2_2]|nr:hypothetical protein [Cyanobacteria bacterium RM1_2_2]